MSKVLLVEDDKNIASQVEQWLKHQKNIVEVVHNGREALDRLRLFNYDAIILDWELPGETGPNVCHEFRQRGGTTPILMLTGKATLADKEVGFDAGADDYLTKPFDLKELELRLRAIMRRGTDVADNTLSVDMLTMDVKLRAVTVSGEKLTLLPKEFSILELLMKHPGEVFSAEAILNRVWPSESDSTDHTVRTYMHTLRKKLAGRGCDSLKTVHGVGYRLENSSSNKLGTTHV